MTLNGLSLGIFTGVFIGGFLGLMWCQFCQKRWGKVITIICFILIFFLIAGFGFSAEEKSFNGGFCPLCNTKYIAVSHHRGSTYYECPECYYGTYF